MTLVGCHRPPLSEEDASLIVDILKLGISVRVLVAFQRLGIGLQTIVRLIEQLADYIFTDLMPLLVQRFRKLTGAFACSA